MTKDELIRLIDGPLAAYLSDDCTYARMIELLNREFPELRLSHADLFPRLFNLSLETTDCLYGDFGETNLLTSWDVWQASEAYLHSLETEEKDRHDAIPQEGLPELVDVPGWETGIDWMPRPETSATNP